MHVSDAVSLIDHVIKDGVTHNVVNGGSGKGISVREALTLIKNELNPQVEIRFNNITREGDPKYLTADVSELMEFQPKIKFTEGIKNYISWFKEHSR